MAYRTSPADLEGMPSGVPHIIGNEAAERFSFYGMKAVLAVFMANYLHYMGDSVGPAMSEAAASEKVHFFNFWVYITPVLGALISDIFLGKYRTIITLSLVYVVGHAALAFMGIQGEARMWLYLGLGLIALGSGAPVVPAASWREPDGSHVLRFEEPIEVIESENLDTAVRLNTRAYNAALERLVLRHPEQWYWVHRRWKADQTRRQDA